MMSAVAAGLGFHVNLLKISRCSTRLADMADTLSKCTFQRFWDIANVSGFRDLPISPAWMLVSLTAWLDALAPDDTLGDKILSEVAKRTLVLGYNC